jgi:acyl carrier protein
MNLPDQTRSTILRLLGDIAPEADLQTIRPEVSLRDQLDIDSMDFLNFVIALHREFQVEIPEHDYPKLATLNGCVDYVMAAKHGLRQAT